MTDDLLGTVKAALAEADGACYVSWRHVHQLAELRHWLRALVARVEQAEAEVERLREAYATLAADASDSNQAATEAETDLAALRLNLTSMQKFTDEIKAENVRLREALRAIMVFRAENLRVTCPGEHDYEPDCTHGTDNCTIMLTAKAALESSRG